MHREVNLTKRVTTAVGSRFCPVVLSGNARVKPDTVVVAGREQYHPEGAYYIEWHENGRRRRLSVGKNAQDAAARRLSKKAELNARNHGLNVASPESLRPLTAAVAQYLSEVEITKKPKTYAAYATALTYFQESCAKQYLEDITRHDLVKFIAYLRDKKKQSPRSVYNKFESVMSFLKAQGIRALVGKDDWPRFTEQEPEIYEEDELDALFAACDPTECLWFEFFLKTGMREQEVTHVCWRDITAGTVRVTHKPEFDWTPKAYKEREIPIPESLVASLRAHRLRTEAGKPCPLVFPTSGCKPKLDFLDCLKAVANRAGLNPDDFWLHKFRATFATRCLCGGIDLRTVQHWLGHSDMESTMRYLKPQRNEAVRKKVNEIFA